MSKRYSDDDFGTIKDVELKDLFRRKKPVDKPVIIVLLFFTVIILLSAFITLASNSGRSESYNDFMSDAVMISARCSNVNAKHNRNYNEYYADITYKYNGTVYTGSQVRIGQEVSEGDYISIYIDPNDPSSIRRNDNTGQGLMVESVIGYCLLGAGLIMLFICIVVVANNIRLSRQFEDSSSIYYDEPIQKSKGQKIETYTGYDNRSSMSDTSSNSDIYNRSTFSETNSYSGTYNSSTYNDNSFNNNNYSGNSFAYNSSDSDSVNVENTLKYNGPKDDMSNGYADESKSVSELKKNTTSSKKDIIRVIRIVIFLIIFVELTFTCLNVVPAIIQKIDNDNFMKTAVSVEGVCDSVRVVEHHSSHGSRHRAYFYYARIRYKFEDQWYLSEEMEISEGIGKGEPYTIYVDPNNPSDGRKPYVLNKFEIIMYSFMAVLVTTIGLVFYKGLKNAIEKEDFGQKK